MAAIVHQKNKKTGVIYVYRSVSCWDKEKQQGSSDLFASVSGYSKSLNRSDVALIKIMTLCRQSILHSFSVKLHSYLYYYRKCADRLTGPAVLVSYKKL